MTKLIGATNKLPPIEHLTFYRLSDTAIEPVKAYEEAVGWDLFTDTPDKTSPPHVKHKMDYITVGPHSTGVLPTGWAVIPPSGTYCSIRSRSGLSMAAQPVFISNAPGTIDPDYRGEIKILLYNASLLPVRIQHGTKIAQLVLDLYIKPSVRFVDTPAPQDTERSSKGFGSTGTKKGESK